MKNIYKVNEEAVKKIAERVYDNGSTVINRNDLEEMFPELRESEDEKIRKELLNAFIESTDSIYMLLTPLKREAFIAWLEKQGKQKHADITDKLKEEYQKGWDAAMQQLPKEVDSQIWQIANNSAIKWEESFAILCASQKAYDKGKKDALKEQKPTEWTAEDEEELKIALNTLEEAGQYSSAKWLKTVCLVPQTMQKPWSEEDDSKLKEVLYYIEYVNKTNVTFQQRDLVHLINWLKSLSPQNQWAPSEEQMQALEYFIINHNEHTGYAKDLEELRQNLKKLKE